MPRKAPWIVLSSALVLLACAAAGRVLVDDPSPQDDSKPASAPVAVTGVPQGRVLRPGVNRYSAPSSRSRVLGTYQAASTLTLSCWREGEEGGAHATWYWLAGGEGYVSASDVRTTVSLPYCVA
ncbi:hypothetical protein [Streptomyces sp. NPDC001594]|uniref:hypothetical protein n=1 Tax=Streptomyces sp. NPDC001594 TaxID=3364590 RepID=UPI0036A321CE